MIRRAFLALALLAPLAGARPAAAAPTPTGFLDRSIKTGDRTDRYVVYVPRDYTADKKWPVVLFLHGSGERGSDGLKQSQVGIGTAVRMFPERYPAIVVMPQCAEGQRWSDAMAAFALKALDDTMKEYSCDEDRQYLTGLSMGGSGSWYIGSRNPKRFAAVVPICGGAEVAAVASAMKDVPVWMFVGDQDRPELVTRCREIAEAMKAPNGNLRYTEYPGVPHNSWDKAYAEKELADWLFAQKRR